MRLNSSTSCRSGQCRFDSASFAVEAVSRLVVIGGLCGATLASAAPLAAAPLALPATIDDAKGPVVSILQPQYSDQLKGSVSVLIGVEARKFTPQSVEMFVDGVSQTEGPIALLSLPSANFTWDTGRHPDGPHKLTVVVTDTQGFRGSSEVTVYINNNRQRDLAPPALQWLSAKNGDTWRGMVNVQLKVVDNFGVKYLFVLLNPSSDPFKKPAKASWLLNRPPYTVPFDSRKLPDGRYVLRALAYDARENEGSAPSLQIDIANNSINPTPFDAPHLGLNPATPPTQANVEPSRQPSGSDSDPIRTDNVVGAKATTEASSSESGLPARSNVNDRIARGPQPGSVQSPSAILSTSGIPDDAIVAAQSMPRTPAESVVTGQSLSRQMVTRPISRPRALPPVVSATAPQSTLKSATVVAALPERARGANEPGLASIITERPNGSVAAHTIIRERITPSSMRAGKLAAPVAQERLGADSLTLSTKDATPVAFSAGAGHNRIAPLSPQTLKTSQFGPSAWVAAGQGSVAAPVMPTLPNPNLRSNRAPLSNRVTLPHVAALPDFTPSNRGEGAAITVTPGYSGLMTPTMPVMHIAQRDETLAAIAKRYHLPVEVLATHNKLSREARIQVGHKVLLPQPLVVTYLGRPVTGDVASMMVGSMGVTPFRFLFEKQGGKLQWDGKTGRVTARNATHQVTLTIGSDAAVVNKKDVMMDLAAFLLSGRTMVPIRFFEKALQAKVEWEPGTGRLFVAMAN